MSLASAFLQSNGENGDYNQYWYSVYTIDQIVADIVDQAASSANEATFTIAFLSTPSIYYSLPEKLRRQSYVFDFDKVWETDRGFVFYDFNKPDSGIPRHLLKGCDMVVIDPPFITRDVWEKYEITSKILLKDCIEGRSKVLCTTVHENALMMNEMFGAKSTAFMPSIPNLVYQYNLYTNYDSRIFEKINPEIPEL